MAVVMLPAALAQAADVTFQPSVELRALASSNPGLDPITSSDSDAYGGVADLATLILVNTPRGETSIRPRLKLQDYTDRDLEPVEAFLDLRSSYQSLRGQFDLWASYDRRDTYVAELPDAEFDDLDPDDPTTPQTGNNRVGLTREQAEIRPAFTYKVTERTSIGSEVLYQLVRYSTEVALDRVDYDYARAQGFVSWAFDPRSDIKTGGYVSRYDARTGVNQTDAYGGFVGLERRWSETAGTTVQVVYEKNEVTFDPLLPKDRTSSWGANAGSYWKGEISELRFSVGRSFTPTGRGGKSTADQIRVQYDRDLSARFQFRGAVRFLRDEAINQIGENGDRDYARLESSLRWRMSPTWFIEGGYTYTYQDRVSDPDTADDHKFHVSIGYLGVGPRRR